MKNVGDEDLVYKQILGDCGCTTVHNKNKSLAKGQTDTIGFTVKTTGRKKGFLHKSIMIFANTDPEINKFQIKAELQ